MLKTCSCWAFAGSEVLSDRFCIQTAGSTNVQLSPQDLVSCDTMDKGCDGGMLMTEWVYMFFYGVSTLDCMAYVSGDGHVPECPNQCDDGSAWVKYKCKQYQAILASEKGIANEIHDNGPVEVAFSVYEDFMQYSSGVYKHTTGKLLGGHAVKAIGWGVAENGDKYWIINNSWGNGWGQDGIFWILKGTNECGIESQPYTCTEV